MRFSSERFVFIACFFKSAAQLKKHKPLGRVLIPLHMLRHQEDVFLDDWTVPQLSQALETPVQVVGIDGFDLCDAVFEL